MEKSEPDSDWDCFSSYYDDEIVDEDIDYGDEDDEYFWVKKRLSKLCQQLHLTNTFLQEVLSMNMELTCHYGARNSVKERFLQNYRENKNLEGRDFLFALGLTSTGVDIFEEDFIGRKHSHYSLYNLVELYIDTMPKNATSSTPSVPRHYANDSIPKAHPRWKNDPVQIELTDDNLQMMFKLEQILDASVEGEILLYHGTLWGHGMSIIQHHIDLHAGRPFLDFNRHGGGFYLGTSFEQVLNLVENMMIDQLRDKAKVLKKRPKSVQASEEVLRSFFDERSSVKGVILVFKMDMKWLEGYKGKVLVEQDDDFFWHEIVNFYRKEENKFVPPPFLKRIDPSVCSEEDIDFIMGRIASENKTDGVFEYSMQPDPSRIQLCLKSKIIKDNFNNLQAIIPVSLPQVKVANDEFFKLLRNFSDPQPTLAAENRKPSKQTAFTIFHRFVNQNKDVLEERKEEEESFAAIGENKAPLTSSQK